MVYIQWYIWNHQGFSAFHGCALYNNLAIKNIDNVHVKLSYKIFDFKIPHPSPFFFLLDNLIYSLFFYISDISRRNGISLIQTFVLRCWYSWSSATVHFDENILFHFPTTAYMWVIINAVSFNQTLECLRKSPTSIFKRVMKVATLQKIIIIKIHNPCKQVM